MNQPIAPTLFDSFARSEEFNTLAGQHKLPPLLWSICLAVERPLPLRDLAPIIGITQAELSLAIHDLERLGLLTRVSQTWEEFLSQSGNTAERVRQPAHAAVRLAAARSKDPLGKPVDSQPLANLAQSTQSHTRSPFLNEEGPSTTKDLRKVVRATLAPRIREPEALPPSPVDFTPSPCFSEVALSRAPEAPAEAEAGVAASLPQAPAGRKLRPLIDAIIQSGGGGVAGQLLVYRVFLRVPQSLLSTAGIESVSLVDDAQVVSDPALIQAIEQAAQSIAGVDWASLMASP